MPEDREHITGPSSGPVTGLVEQAPEAVLHLRSAVRSGVPWYQALLEAVGLWTLPQEVYQGRSYRYLIQGEALDWLLLAERLCDQLDGVVSDEDREALLFSGKLPEEVSQQAFQELIGVTKHRAYLNYWYGVVVEEALQLAVEEEVRKRHRARCYPDSEDLVEEAFAQLYGKPRRDLLEEFCRETRDPSRSSSRDSDLTKLDFSLTDLKEFTYWLFKRRINMWDPARVASDIRKGIRRLHQLEQEGGAISPGYAYQTSNFSRDSTYLGEGAIEVDGRTFK